MPGWAKLLIPVRRISQGILPAADRDYIGFLQGDK